MVREEKGIADDTVICIAPDHFPYGLDSDAALGNYDWKTDLGYYSSSRGIFTPIDEGALFLKDYVNQISSIVRNRMTFSKSVVSHDYYTHVYDEVLVSE